ncbi:hypothetical protein [Rhizobium sp. Leaf341]|uniref:hypothetical protein n=1 Tax=Rhizobium sp. Leaf341 TaxID=1736344 RepID=UPI000AE6110D|nr:hypothetical protein [Rhizobium sp. Leaf341]
MSSKKPLAKYTAVFAADEWEGKAAYRSLPLRSHSVFDHARSPIAARRSFLIRRVLLVVVECALILGLATALFLAIVPGSYS